MPATSLRFARPLRAPALCSILLLFSTLAPLAPCAAPPRDLLSLLPEDTLFAIQAPDAPALLAAWDASPLARFCADPRAAECLAPLRQRVSALNAELPGGDPGSLGRALKCLAGSAVLAAVPSANAKDSPFVWVVIFEHNGSPLVGQIFDREAAAGRDEKVEKIPGNAGPIPFTRVRTTKQGQDAKPIDTPAELDRIPMAAGAKPKSKAKTKSSPGIANLSVRGAGSADKSARSAGQADKETKDANKAAKSKSVDEFDYYSGSDIAVQAEGDGIPIIGILNRLAASASPAPLPSLKKLMESKGLRPAPAGDKTGDGRIEAYFNLGATGRWYETHKGGLNLPMGINAKELALGGAGWLAVSGRLEKDRLAISGRIAAPVPPKGIAQGYFLGAGAPEDASSIVPASAVDYNTASVAPAKLWDLFLNAIGNPNDPIAALLNLQLQAFTQSTGLDLQRDIVGRLGDDIIRFVPADDDLRETPRGQAFVDPTVWAFNVQDHATLAKNIDALLGYGTQVYGAYQLDKETSRDGAIKLWTLRSGRPSTGYTGAPLLTAAMAGGHLMISRRREGIEAALARINPDPAGKKAALHDSPAFAEAMSQLPAGRFSEGYADMPGLLRLVNAKFLPELAGPDAGAWFNPDALPGKSVMDKFFGSFGRSFSRREDGVGFEALLLLRPASGFGG